MNNDLTSLGAITGGKMPPCEPNIEKVVLGALMLERNAFGKVEGVLSSEMFYNSANEKIYNSIISLSKKSRPIDIMEVVSELKSMGELDQVGGPYYVTTLTNSVVSAANIEYHAQRILEAWKKRKIIEMSVKLLEMGYSDQSDSAEAITLNEKILTALSLSNASVIKHLSEIIVDVVREVEAAVNSDTHIIGVPSGFTELDKKTHGWQKSDLIILAARPSVGKTAFALNLARNATKANIPVIFFSLEMSSAQLTKRLISAESGVFLENIITGNLNDFWKTKMYEGGIRPLSESNFIIDDTPGLNLYQLKSKAREAVRKFGIGMIVVDYLQLMSGMDKKKNREGEISDISRGLKGLAKELNIPIIALSQLSRNIENREKKEPQLSDLRESGAIEQDADIVVFLSRPEYYGINTNELGESTNGLTKVKIAKNRSGKLGTIDLKAELSIQKFFDWEGEVPDLPAGNWKPLKDVDDVTPF